MSDRYTQDYRHFDSLIWQVPAWASAVFSFALTSSILGLANAKAIERELSIDATDLIAVFLFGVFILLLQFMNVFLRFRLHQRTIHRPERVDVPRLWFMVSGQTSLLLMLFVEASVVLGFALVAAGALPPIAHAASAVFLFGGFLYVEMRVRRLAAVLRSAREATQLERIVDIEASGTQPSTRDANSLVGRDNHTTARHAGCVEARDDER